MFKFKYNGENEINTNQLFNASFELTIDNIIVPGDVIAIAFRHMTDIGKVQAEDKENENFIRIETRENIKFEISNQNDMNRHPWNQGFSIRLEKGILNQGDLIKIHLGGALGFRCQSYTQEDPFSVRIGFREKDTQKWTVSEEFDCFRIIGNRPNKIIAHVSDINSEKNNKSLAIKVEDAYRNATLPQKDLSLSVILDDKKLVDKIHLKKGMEKFNNIKVESDDKWHRLTLVSDDGAFHARTNPFGPSLIEGHKLYFGEIHAHSRLCDGTNSPAYLYKYAKDAVGLDFASATSHDYLLTPEDWEEVKRATKKSNKSGEFITLLGYEWSGTEDRGGDHNIYYLEDNGPLIYNGQFDESGLGYDSSAWDNASKYIKGSITIKDVCKKLSDTDSIIIPHCGGRVANLDFYNEEKMPLLEIDSCHRNFEFKALEAMERKIKLGFCGGSDDHRGQVGDSSPNAREWALSKQSGLIAVYAKSLTRKGIWEAIQAKRVYATNGARIILSFCVDDNIMGSEIEVKKDDTLEFDIKVVLDGFMDRIEVVRQTDTIGRICPYDHYKHNRIAQYQTTFKDKVKSGLNGYYIRVYQSNGGIAWSSPIWVTGN